MAKVQFARNLTESDAIQQKTDNGNVVYFSTDTHSIVMNGDVYGGACNVSTEEAAYLAKLYADMIEAKFKISTSGASNKLPGDTVTLYTTATWDGAAPARGSVTVTSSPELTWEETSTNGKFSASYTIPADKTGVTSFTVTVKYGDYTKTSTVSVSSYNKVVYGWSTESTISAITDIMNSASPSVSSSAAGTYTFTNTAVGYYYIAIPTGTTVPTSLANGYGTENDVTQVLFTELKTEGGAAIISGYKVFRLADPQAAGATHKVKFA